MKKSKGQAINKKQSKTKKNIQESGENEIIIGLAPKRVETKKKKTKKKSKNKKAVKNSSNNNENIQGKKTKKNFSKKSKIKLRIIKWILIIVILLIAIILFMRSSVFNIKQIVVLNNSKISSEEVANLSTLTIGKNMFETTKKAIREAIKTNAYVEDVKIKRNLNGIVTLEIEERKPEYMLQLENSYAYMNYQGYILEISENALEVPTIIGYKTSSETITPGARLDVEDLKKLQDVIKIIKASENTSLEGKITKINIEDTNNYILTIASENKTIKFGDSTNEKIKMLKIEAIIKETKGEKGEIYFQNLEKTIFRPSNV